MPGNGRYHCDWISNADKVRVIYWQLTGDKIRRQLVRHTLNRRLPITIFCKNCGGISPARRSWANSNTAEIVLEELNENARSLRL